MIQTVEAPNLAMKVSSSNVTVSTSGLPAGIRRLAREAPRVRLALSIGSARPEVRSKIMPVENRHPLHGELFDAVVEHAVLTGQQPLWAVTPLRGINDSVEDATSLALLWKRFREATGGIRPIVSVIPYNTIGEGDPYERLPLEEEVRFREDMLSAGLHSRKRYSGGGDVAAACGQLAGKQLQAVPSELQPGSLTNWAGTWAAGLNTSSGQQRREQGPSQQHPLAGVVLPRVA